MSNLLSELEAVVGLIMNPDFLCPECGHFIHTRG